MWFSTLDTPEVNGSSGKEEYYSAQLNISWPVRSPADEVPECQDEKLKKMKNLATMFEERLKTPFHDIPEGTEILEIKLADWACLDWPSYDGKVTLMGDAAHAMTMYRGEAANHGITDAMHLHNSLLVLSRGDITQVEAVRQFEEEMRERTSWAVMMSRQACLDAHSFSSLTKDSAILARRAQRL
ncbi:hypothetical protein B0J14DRAFT_270208 [Halenospora varia]|nr:hypothetical protein B0J14DRAFT_270208 [Halenospora varia]